MQIITVSSVPSFAAGYVRDLSVRWALEEAKLPYSVKTYDRGALASDEYRHIHPFSQVPAFEDGDVKIFESGAITLYVTEKSETLMWGTAAQKARARMWAISALNTFDPVVTNFIRADDAADKEEWAKLRRPMTLTFLTRKLADLNKWLEGKEYLEGKFSVGDLMMTVTIRHLVDSGVMNEFPNVKAYHARCESRPAFKKALADQIKLFTDNEAKN